MKNTMKKMLAVVLVLVMCVSVAMPVFAADPKCPGDAEDQHTKENCDYVAVVGGKHEPTCSKQGYTVYQCEGCQAYFADDIVPDLEGDCQWTVDVAATCAKAGKQHCTRCGAVEEISATGNHDYEWDTDATCGFPGEKKTGICKVCKEKTTVSIAKEHKFPTLPEIDVYPECGGKEGKAHYTCQNKGCGYKKYVVIYALEDHMDLVDLTDKIKNATCGTDGLKIKNDPLTGQPYAKAEKCTVCGYDTTEKVNAQHTWGAEYTYAPKSCMEYGFVFKGCILCGETETVRVIERPGHNYVSATGAANATCSDKLVCDWSQYVCTDSKCIVDGVHTLHPTKGCGAEVEGKECKYVWDKQDATCVAPGYKWEKCEVCGNEKANSRVQTEPATGKHTWNEVPVYNPTTDPTCQHPGIYTYLCVNEGCTAFKTEDREQLKHVYDEGETTQPLCGVNGYIVYTCTQPGCVDPETKKAHVIIEMPESLRFNPATPEHHGDLATGIAAGTIVPTLNATNPVTGKPYPNADATCGVGSVTTYKCEVCTARNPYFDHDNDPSTAPRQPWVTFAVIGEAQEHLGLTDVTPADLPTHCLDTGVTGGWRCTSCGKSQTSVAVKTDKTEHSFVITSENKLPTCSAPVTYKCECVFNIVDDEGNVYKKDVACGETDEDTCTGNINTLKDQRNNNCDVWGYQHFECPKCQEGYIDNFEYATGHNMVENKNLYVPAECATDGKQVFECDVVHINYDTTTVDCDHTETKVLDRLGHADKDGNVIECVDANGKPIVDDILCFRKEADGGCCTCADDVVCEGHSKSWKEVHKWVDTEVVETCISYKYILHVCEYCEYDYTDTVFVKADHNLKGAYKVDNKGNIVKDKDGNPVPDFTNTRWKDVTGKKADYDKAGEKSFQCLTAGCTHKVYAPYVLTDVNLTVSIRSDVKVGNGYADKLVNSGRMAVTVKANAYHVDLRSIYFELPYSTTYFTFDKTATKIETKLFGDSGFAVGEKNGVIYVEMTNPGNMTNVEVNGTDIALITFFFDIKNTVVEKDSVTDFSMNVTNTSAIKINDSNKNVAVDSTVGKACASKVYVLGNVTGGTIEAFDKPMYADDYDVVALVDLMMKNKYDAVADMNKDGKVDELDFADLGQYIVNAKTYDKALLKDKV